MSQDEIRSASTMERELGPVDIHVAVEIDLANWPPNLPRRLRYFVVDGRYEKVGCGYEIHVRSDGIHFLGFPRNLGETVSHGSYTFTGNRVSPRQDPQGYIIGLIRLEPMRYRLEVF